MKFISTLLVVKNISKAQKFYEEVFGLKTVKDNDGNMELTGGIVLQEKKYWTKFIGKRIKSKSNSSELYFEEENIEEFVQKLRTLYPKVEFVCDITTHSWGQKVVRFYDLDGNLIEVGTPMA